MVLGPDADGFVPATGGEVVTKGAPADIPDGTFVAFVHNETGPGLERPETYGFVAG